jgi:tRNA (cytidine32/uridine32-2'-O)-methyltransferase
MLKNIRIVMVETSHPGNIGAAARAMKNMCLEQLVLVQPKMFPSGQAEARASGAQDLLRRARVVDSLEAAVAECPLVIGASARQRSDIWTVSGPREAAAQALAHAGRAPVALVFGRERSGLTSAELDCCTHLVHVPANPEYSSLNIAMAVQVMAYELRMQSLEGQAASVSEAAPERASAQAMEGLFGHLEQVLYEIGFLQPGREGRIMQRMRRLFHRAAPDAREVNILRGILTAVQRYRGDPGDGGGMLE